MLESQNFFLKEKNFSHYVGKVFSCCLPIRLLTSPTQGGQELCRFGSGFILQDSGLNQ